MAKFQWSKIHNSVVCACIKICRPRNINAFLLFFGFVLVWIWSWLYFLPVKLDITCKVGLIMSYFYHMIIDIIMIYMLFTYWLRLKVTTVEPPLMATPDVWPPSLQRPLTLVHCHSNSIKKPLFCSHPSTMANASFPNGGHYRGVPL